MRLLAAKAGEKFYVQVKPQPPGNNFTNRSIAEGLTEIGICQESTQDESRTSEELKRFYEVPASFVSSLLRGLPKFQQFFTVYHSFYGEEKTKYEPNKGTMLVTKPRKKAKRRQKEKWF